MHFRDQQWTFQQDSAPAHKATLTQNWIREHFPNFISSQEWPPNSPDINPLDCSVCSILEFNACAEPHESVDSLKLALKKAWDELSLETVAKIVDDFPKRLEKCINSCGGHFEKM